MQAEESCLCGKAVERGLDWVHKLAGAGSHGISRVGQKVLPRLMEHLDLCLLAGWGRD